MHLDLHINTTLRVANDDGGKTKGSKLRQNRLCTLVTLHSPDREASRVDRENRSVRSTRETSLSGECNVTKVQRRFWRSFEPFVSPPSTSTTAGGPRRQLTIVSPSKSCSNRNRNRVWYKWNEYAYQKSEEQEKKDNDRMPSCGMLHVFFRGLTGFL
jgi:hypothetical protein